MNRTLWATGACAMLLCAASSARATTDYQLLGSYAAPNGAFDILPDGRLITVTPDGVIGIQDAINAGSYTAAGSTELPIAPFGASFARVSPDGSFLAIGDNNFGVGATVGIVDINSLNPNSASATQKFEVGNFQAHWLSNSQLLVTGANNNTFSPDLFLVEPNAGTTRTLIAGTGGGSGGVTSDGTTIFIGDGFNTDNNGEPTGNIRAFDVSTLLAATTPQPFTSGVLVADALSANPIGFDNKGNLLVGGGDFFAGSDDAGYAAVIDANAVALALAGGDVAPDSAETRLSPAGSTELYDIRFNNFTEELLVIGGGTVFRYAIPAPGSAAVAVGAAGYLASRRRRAG